MFDHWLKRIADAQSDGMLDDIQYSMYTAEQNGELSKEDYERLMIVHDIAMLKLIYQKEAYAME